MEEKICKHTLKLLTWQSSHPPSPITTKKIGLFGGYVWFHFKCPSPVLMTETSLFERSLACPGRWRLVKIRYCSVIKFPISDPGNKGGSRGSLDPNKCRQRGNAFKKERENDDTTVEYISTKLLVGEFWGLSVDWHEKSLGESGVGSEAGRTSSWAAVNASFGRRGR